MSESLIEKMDPTAEQGGTVLYEAPLIQATHAAIKAAQERLTREAWGAERPFNYGKLVEALDQASDALFNVLNLAWSHLDCAESEAAIKRGWGV